MAASYDTIVIGLGGMGSATLYHLAARGQRVLGLEQFAPGHTNGSSHGDSRIIREQYFEHPLYVPLVQRAYELWRELESLSGRSLMTITGGLMIGPKDGMVVRGAIRSASYHDLKYELLDWAEVNRRYPAFGWEDDLIAVLDPHAGFLDPEACTAAHVAAARASGAEVRYQESGVRWVAEGNGVRVTTGAGDSFTARHLVLAAGAWTNELLGDRRLPLTVERQVVFWFEPPRAADLYLSERFPIYAYEYTPGAICYGFPSLPRGIKAAVMHSGETADHPAQIRLNIDPAEVRPLRTALRQILPGLGRAGVWESAVCLFTNTPDHHFIIDWHPDHKQVLISSPCSGHGFKFASAIGEAQADLITLGKSRFDLSPFRIGRFSE